MFVIFEALVFSVYHVFSENLAARPSYTSFQIPVRLQIKHNSVICNNVKLVIFVNAAKDCLLHWILSWAELSHQFGQYCKAGVACYPPSTS